MKKNKTTLIMILFFFLGLSILTYPFISDLYNRRVQSAAIVDDESILEKYGSLKFEEELKKAEEYNLKLKSWKDPFYNYDTIKNYNEVLNIGNNKMMGYISIDKINVKLPIYHGTSSEVLSKAVGHLEGSTLPIGGKRTHSVLSAHRGLPTALLFTNLDKLEKGDTFTITILNRTLTYEVDQILIVNPKQVNSLKIDKNEDYVTLVTCTPYGINTQRLLVRGKRIENVKQKTFVTTEAFKISRLIVTPLVAIPVILLSLLIIIFKPIENKRKIKEKYIYPSKIKKEFGGRNNDEKNI